MERSQQWTLPAVGTAQYRAARQVAPVGVVVDDCLCGQPIAFLKCRFEAQATSANDTVNQVKSQYPGRSYALGGGNWLLMSCSMYMLLNHPLNVYIYNRRFSAISSLGQRRFSLPEIKKSRHTTGKSAENK